MPAVTITTDDLTPFATITPAKAEAMIADAMAIATLIAPCIATDDFAHPDAAKAIIRGAVLRWNEAGSGALQQETAGPFSGTLDTRQIRRGMYWPSEITQLQDLCKDEQISVAFSIDTLPAFATGHAEICSLNFGAQWCSCGAVLTNGIYPLYEV